VGYITMRINSSKSEKLGQNARVLATSALWFFCSLAGSNPRPKKPPTGSLDVTSRQACNPEVMNLANINSEEALTFEQFCSIVFHYFLLP
jgi:hypothetical protein